MTIDEDIPWHILHCRGYSELISAIVPAAVTAFVGLAFYASSGSETTAMVVCIFVFVALQVSLGWWALMHAPSRSEMQRIGAWIRAYGPELHRRLRADIRHSGDAIGSPHLVTYQAPLVPSELTKPQLEWALQSDYYDRRELNILRLMHEYMSRFGHVVGTQRVVSYSHIVELPYFALSEEDITACML
jgi:hypothetical protein